MWPNCLTSTGIYNIRPYDKFHAIKTGENRNAKSPEDDWRTCGQIKSKSLEFQSRRILLTKCLSIKFSKINLKK